MGVVYAPVLRTIYYGSQAEDRGQKTDGGAWKATDCAGKSVDEIFSSAVSLPLSSVLRPPSSAIRIVASRSHCNGETKAFIADLEAKHGAVELVSSGSSLKLCMVAEGSADVYPRIAPTMEWDTAAAQAVVEAAGGAVVRYDSSVPAESYLTQSAGCVGHSEETPCAMLHALSYNKENLLNPFFVVSRK
jgi:3'(2'), 5'-bisphosphate nucleotidase